MNEVKTIKELRERHKKEIEEFQKYCKHEDSNDWKEEWKAYDIIAAYHTGYLIKVCKRCEKIIKRKRKHKNAFF